MHRHSFLMEVASNGHRHRTENVSEPKLHHLTHLHHETPSPTDQQMHVRGVCGFSQCPFATPVAHHLMFSILFAPKQSEFCSTSLRHALLSPHTSDDNNLRRAIVQSLQHDHIAESRQLHTAQSQSHTRSRCPDHHYLLPDTCRPLRSPAAKREPCLQPLRLLPILPLMLMILLQLHAATFSALIAKPDSTEYMLVVVSFSAPSVFLELLFVYALQVPPQDQ